MFLSSANTPYYLTDQGPVRITYKAMQITIPQNTHIFAVAVKQWKIEITNLSLFTKNEPASLDID